MSHANQADKLLIKPAAGARSAAPHTRGRIIRKARERGQSPDESHAAQRQPGWQWSQTDQLSESYRPSRRVVPRSHLREGLWVMVAFGGARTS